MPELPEVETTRRGLLPLLVGRTLEKITIHDVRLRYPVDPKRMKRQLQGQKIRAIHRRGKYLLIECGEKATLLAHLGMTGRFQFCQSFTPIADHVHATFVLGNKDELRFIDPRRFGVLESVSNKQLADHRLLRNLGPEPLTEDFDETMLFAMSRKRKGPIKNFIMNANVVVGVGNIYASEALFMAGIHPHRAAGRLSQKRIGILVGTIKEVLSRAIEVGGTTLRDFLDPNEEAGYFAISLNVYDREGEACKICGAMIKRSIQSNRSTFYCPQCQK